MTTIDQTVDSLIGYIDGKYWTVSGSVRANVNSLKNAGNTSLTQTDVQNMVNVAYSLFTELQRQGILAGSFDVPTAGSKNSTYTGVMGVYSSEGALKKDVADLIATIAAIGKSKGIAPATLTAAVASTSSDAAVLEALQAIKKGISDSTESFGEEVILSIDNLNSARLGRNPAGDFEVYDADMKNVVISSEKLDDAGIAKEGLPNGVDAAKYFQECLVNGDANSMEKCLTTSFASADFDVVISSMHPVVALRTLQKFGFRKHKVYVAELGRELWMVENVHHWKANYLNKHFTNDLVLKMFSNKNAKIVTYLNSVASYVNQNPAILNKDYSGKAPSAVQVPEGISKYGDAVAKHRDRPSTITDASDLIRLQTALRIAPAYSVFSRLSGGAAKSAYDGIFPENFTKFGTSQSGGDPFSCGAPDQSGSRYVADLLTDQVAQLKNSGFTVSAETEQAINAHVAKAKQNEQELRKTVCLIGRFEQLKRQNSGQNLAIFSGDLESQLVGRHLKLSSRLRDIEVDLAGLLVKLLESAGGYSKL